MSADQDQQHLVIGKSVCISCGHEAQHVRAHIRAAWVDCGICGTKTAMFIYRGADRVVQSHAINQQGELL